MTKRHQTTLPVDVLLAALEAEGIVAIDAEIDEALGDAGVASVAIDEVRAVLLSACGSEANSGLPVGLPGWFQAGLARH